jgi:hypothetical protein
MRIPVFETLNAMIAAGWGDVPRTKIPENWRDIPAEVLQQDLERIRAEELTPPAERIAQIEHDNQRVDPDLVAAIFANQSRRRKERIKNRSWADRVAWREAAMRARRVA